MSVRGVDEFFVQEERRLSELLPGKLIAKTRFRLRAAIVSVEPQYLHEKTQFIHIYIDRPMSILLYPCIQTP